MNFHEFPERRRTPYGRLRMVERRAESPPSPPNFPQRMRRMMPGLVTGAADVDPALVLTATLAGATFKYSLIWVAVLAIPFLLTIYSVAARIGEESRRGLVDILRSQYGKKIAIAFALLLCTINLLMIVADLMAVTEALSILTAQSRVFFVAAVAFAVWYVLIFKDYENITTALSMISLPLFIYVVAAAFSGPRVESVIRGALVPPSFASTAYVTMAIAIIGSLITPYVIVWQTSSRRDAATASGRSEAEHRLGAGVTITLCISIMIASASMLELPVDTPLTTRMAAEALTPAAGKLGPILFAIGIIGAGMVALPILVASMCFSVSEAFGWRYGLREHPWEAGRFYALVSGALVFAAAVNFLRIDPVKALFYSMVLAGLLTVPLLYFIYALSNNPKVVRSRNTAWQNFWLRAAITVISIAVVLFVLSHFY